MAVLDHRDLVQRAGCEPLGVKGGVGQVERTARPPAPLAVQDLPWWRWPVRGQCRGPGRAAGSGPCRRRPWHGGRPRAPPSRVPRGPWRRGQRHRGSRVRQRGRARPRCAWCVEGGHVVLDRDVSGVLTVPGGRGRPVRVEPGDGLVDEPVDRGGAHPVRERRHVAVDVRGCLRRERGVDDGLSDPPGLPRGAVAGLHPAPQPGQAVCRARRPGPGSAWRRQWPGRPRHRTRRCRTPTPPGSPRLRWARRARSPAA